MGAIPWHTEFNRTPMTHFGNLPSFIASFVSNDNYAKQRTIIKVIPVHEWTGCQVTSCEFCDNKMLQGRCTQHAHFENQMTPNSHNRTRLAVFEKLLDI